MKAKFLIEAGVSIECKNCGNRTTVPALKVSPGIMCQCCGAALPLDAAAYAAKAALLIVACKQNDVALD